MNNNQEDMRLKNALLGTDQGHILLRQDEVSSLTGLVITALYDLTFNAHYVLKSQRLRGNNQATNKSIKVITDLFVSDKFENPDCILQDIQATTKSLISASKDTIKQKNSKGSVMDTPEFLYTEYMIKLVILYVIQNSKGPIDFSEELIAFNTFEGYDKKRNYETEPPKTKEEQEIVAGVLDLIDLFSFNNKKLNIEMRDMYIDNCYMFMDLIFNYVVREMEISDAVTPLGQIQFDPNGNVFIRLYLFNIEYKPDNSPNGFSQIMTYDALPYKNIIEVASGSDELSEIFGKYMFVSELVDYKLTKMEGSDVFMNCFLLVPEQNLKESDLKLFDSVEFKEEKYIVFNKIGIELDYETYLNLFLKNDYSTFTNTMVIAMQNNMNIESTKKDLSTEKATEVIAQLARIIENNGGDINC